MAKVQIRQATLADAAAITEVHCSHVGTWRRGGKGEAVPYPSLSLYERWLHGGPWMSVETCAVHLNRWLWAGHRVLVAQVEGEVVGEAEFVVNDEPAPYGAALHLSLLIVHAAHQGCGIGRALVEAGGALARQEGYTVMTTQPERTAEPFYSRVGFEPWLRLKEWQATAQVVPIVGEPEPMFHAPYPAEGGLALRVGRYQCARQAWDDLPFYLALPEHVSLRWGRWRTVLAGRAVWLGLQAQPLEPIQADGFIWAPPEMALGPAVAALRGLAARLGFAYVDLLLEEWEGQGLAAAYDLEPQDSLTIWKRPVGQNPPAGG